MHRQNRVQRSSNEKLSFFNGDGFSLIPFLYERYKNKHDTIVLASSSRFGTCAFWPQKVNFKIRLQVRSRSDHDPSRSICALRHPPKLLDEPSRLAPFALLCMHPVATYWGKTGCDLIWSQLTSGDLPVTPDRQLHRIDHHSWGEWPWLWSWP